MANTITGRIYKITPTESIATKKGTTFMKRQLIICVSKFDQNTGEKIFENIISFEVGGEELCKQLDSYHNNELVTVSFDLNGREVIDKETSQTKYFTSIRAYKVERVQRRPTDQQQGTQQPIAAHTTAAPQNVAAASSAPTKQEAFAQNDDLPF